MEVHLHFAFGGRKRRREFIYAKLFSFSFFPQNSINLFIREILSSHSYARVRNPTSYTLLCPTGHKSITILVIDW